MELYTASNQWSSRPADQRFLTLESLKESVDARRLTAREIERLPLNKLGIGYDAGTNEVLAKLPSGMQMKLSNWSFGQLARQSGAPADYLRKLPAQYAALNMQYGLRQSDPDNETKVLFSNGDGYTAKAFNGPTYGRIWDADVVGALMNTIDTNVWNVPLKAYDGVNSIEATTLYASDRDIFIFLTDETRPIEVDGKTYFRGFFTWNSEVGSATFGISTFLFSMVCANRIIWGARDVEELRIRHTALAPSRFLEEAAPVLTALSEASDKPIIAAINKAKEYRVGETADAAEKWLMQRGFQKKDAVEAVKFAAQGGDTGSDGDPTSLWSLVNGGTFAAQSNKHANQRTFEERKWSSLLNYVGIEIGTLPGVELAALPSTN